jgi:hypothetical protein
MRPDISIKGATLFVVLLLSQTIGRAQIKLT